MEALRESWCFCKGVSKSERIQVTIFSSKSSAIAGISGAGTGFLIHRNLLLTTHGNIPSVAAAESSEIQLHNNVSASLVPHRFFITSSILDLTIVGLDATDGDSNAQLQQPHYLKTCSKQNLDLGSVIYLLGYTEKNKLTVGAGKVVIATDNLIKLSTDGISWSPGSAGFNAQGSLAFMICDPMKLATSPNTKSSSTSSSSSTSWKKDLMVQFGIPIPIICDWLNQHWEGSLNELNEPKLPLVRLMSVGQKSEHSCSSFTLRPVFKSEVDDDGTPSSSNTVSKPRDQPGSRCPVASNTIGEQAPVNDSHATRLQGIPTPEIYESPKLTSVPFGKKVSAQTQLLDINFPPKIAKPAFLRQPSKLLPPIYNENSVELPPQSPVSENGEIKETGTYSPHEDAEVESTASINMAHIEAPSSSSPVEVSEIHNSYTSEGETMYSAETAESRNYPSPREAKFQDMRRSQSCVNYNRWVTPVQRNPAAHRASLEKHRSFIHGRKMYSKGETSQWSNLCSPTVSSIMKKRNNPEQPNRPQQSADYSSPRWLF